MKLHRCVQQHIGNRAAHDGCSINKMQSRVLNRILLKKKKKRSGAFI